MKKIFAALAAVLVAALLIGDHAARHANQAGFATGYRAALAATERTATASPENIYPTCGVVVALDLDADTVTVEDTVGLTWMFYGVEDWRLGDIAAMIMYDYDTPTVTDDEIIDVKYCGVTAWFEEIAARVTEE